MAVEIDTREEELARFREQWKAEVRQKQQQQQQSTAQPAPAQAPSVAEPPSAPVRTTTKSKHQGRHARERSTEEPLRPVVPIPVLSASQEPTPLAHNLQSAVAVYGRAVEAEQRGRLDEALDLYRKSFRMDSNVDKAYHRALMLEITAGTQSLTMGASSSSKERESNRFSSPRHTRNDSVPVKIPHLTIAALLASFSSTDVFEYAAEDEKLGVPFARLPDEIVVLVLRQFAQARDVASLERFGTINKKARLVSLDQSLWRDLVYITYVPPQIDDDTPLDEIASDYGFDYRRFFMEHPRVRMDGVYIAVCHYVRQGLGENAWINVTHLVTYHRYLRFLPNGTVLSLLLNDDHAPSDVVHQLKPSLEKKGLFVGSWRLQDSTVFITDLADPRDQQLLYGFEMTLHLRSKPIGRWNKLELEDYSSVNISTGEVQPLGLKNERPFWFSRVRSYGTA
ncbi:hypothetical protein BOTBODRAFT_28125 [Botryobasidium botryosum FD-172 SS1]|uniref:F-box protein Hrt3/FBXO9 C-terminal domain-containing protein n=1 Tax=Botryobasidium botryosum (strain FD-172 SS1) TaxID=930990 RepID=A0A067MXW7_BOTB1|nr:hypothetical protein BOTBODRAFT_28125 [Botryobasidium botryosum FD-172 SS1]